MECNSASVVNPVLGFRFLGHRSFTPSHRPPSPEALKRLDAKTYLWLVGNGGMGYNYSYYYYHSSIPY